MLLRVMSVVVCYARSHFVANGVAVVSLNQLYDLLNKYNFVRMFDFSNHHVLKHR